MSRTRLSDRPIQPRKDYDEDDIESDVDDEVHLISGTEAELNSSGSESSPAESDAESDSNPTSSEHEADQDDLKDISFGALARAQASLAPQVRSRKRKASDIDEPTPPTEDRVHSTRDDAKPPVGRPNQPLHRTSKHAPVLLSSKHPVTRKRPQLFEPSPGLKSRDPRFDPTVTSTTLNPQTSVQANKNYAFLTSYQANEILDLKSKIKKSKNEHEISELKRKVMSMESRIRNAAAQQKERELMHKHKQQEREAIREGKKDRPYFLKRSEVRKEIEKERLEGMGKKARELMEKRKIKRVKGKEFRDMPSVRRTAGD